MTNAIVFPPDTKSFVWPGWNNLWPFPCPFLDLFWSDSHWKSCDQNAHPGKLSFILILTRNIRAYMNYTHERIKSQCVFCWCYKKALIFLIENGDERFNSFVVSMYIWCCLNRLVDQSNSWFCVLAWTVLNWQQGGHFVQLK